MANPILEVKGLQKSFGGVVAVDNVDLQVSPKETLAIIGSNGAGKTTFYNMLSGRIKPSKGQIYFEGKDITGLPPHRISRMGISRSFQINNIFPELTVRENVEVALTVFHGQSKCWYNFYKTNKSIQLQADQLLRELTIEDLSSQRAGTISYGDKRLLEIAIVLAIQPHVVLLDEPTAGMTPEETRRVIGLVKSLSETGQYTFVITEHDMEVVFSVSDRIMVMHRGACLVIGNPEQIKTNPEVRAAYLGEDTQAD